MDVFTGMTILKLVSSFFSLYHKLIIQCCIYPSYIKIISSDCIWFITEYFKFIEQPIVCNKNELNESINYYIQLYHKYITPHRTSGETIVRNVGINIENIQRKLEIINDIPSQVQRSTEWIVFRQNHITASNLWKILFSDKSRNQFIYEKCTQQKSNKSEISECVNIESPMHWGQKYEPLSIRLYEHIYNTKIKDYGCIPHNKIQFLAASPDGINVDPGNPRYGRMLEVKNVYSRVIDGIPKMEYWVQVQIQLEVCDLNECDFLETKFKEYIDEEDYKNDTQANYKGVMLMFNDNGKIKYIYSPINCVKYKEWQDYVMNDDNNINMNWISTIYWKLDTISCVLILRNKKWFNSIVNKLELTWNIIQTEGQTNTYEHRMPVKKNCKKRKVSSDTIGFTGCLLKIMPT